MKKKSNIIVILLCVVLGISVLTQCGSSDSGETGGNGGTAITNNDSDDTSTADITIEEQVLLDRDGILITATEYVTDSIWGDGIKLLIENNSDKTVTIGCSALIVNNYMITDLFSSEIAAGKKANEVMYLSSSELRAAGIESVGQVEVYFHAFDASTYETLFQADCVTIQTSEYANMDTTLDNVGIELYNENGVKIIGKAVDEDSFWGTAILLYCENTSGKNVTISVEEMSINGFMMSPFFATTVYDGKMSLDEITIFQSDLDENEIEKIEEIELKFHIFNSDTYSTIDESEAITFTAQ